MCLPEQDREPTGLWTHDIELEDTTTFEDEVQSTEEEETSDTNASQTAFETDVERTASHASMEPDHSTISDDEDISGVERTDSDSSVHPVLSESFNGTELRYLVRVDRPDGSIEEGDYLGWPMPPGLCFDDAEHMQLAVETFRRYHGKIKDMTLEAFDKRFPLSGTQPPYVLPEGFATDEEWIQYVRERLSSNNITEIMTSHLSLQNSSMMVKPVPVGQYYTAHVKYAPLAPDDELPA